MFPYSDNLKHQKGCKGIFFLISILCIINIPILLDHKIAGLALKYLSFIPLYFSVYPWYNVHTLVTSIFLHGDIFHLLGNCLFLWVFGRSLERLFGTTLFLIIFPLLSIIGLLLHWIINPDSAIPVIGSSGAFQL